MKNCVQSQDLFSWAVQTEPDFSLQSHSLGCPEIYGSFHQCNSSLLKWASRTVQGNTMVETLQVGESSKTNADCRHNSSF